jgi:hypothetical protein
VPKLVGCVIAWRSGSRVSFSHFNPLHRLFSHCDPLSPSPPTDSICALTVEDVTLSPDESHEPILVPTVFASRQLHGTWVLAVHVVVRCVRFCR